MLICKEYQRGQIYDYLEMFIAILDESDVDSKLTEWVNSDDNLSQDPTSDVPNFRILTDEGTVDVYHRQDDEDGKYYLDFEIDGEPCSGFECPLDSFPSCLTAAEQVAIMIENAIIP